MRTLLFGVLGTAALAAEPAPDIPFVKYELDNGLDVILAPDRSTPVVYTSVWYHVGSKDEVAGRTGFAHLFEHIMFQGSLSVEGEYFGPLQAVGADINGTTSFDRTNYFERLPARYLPLALFQEADRMGTLTMVLDKAKLDNQRLVVRNERRQRYENVPYGEAIKDLYAATFPEGSPYHHMPIGSHADLEAASLEDVKAFFDTWYVPNNASLVIAGDFDEAVARRLVQEHFGGIPRGKDPVRPTPAFKTLTEKKVLRQYLDVPEQRVWLAWQSPPALKPGDAELDLLSSLLTDGKDSRLYKRLVKESKVAKTISASQGSLLLQSAYIISATPSPGKTTDQVVAEIDAVIGELLASAPPTADEIAAARAGFERSYFDDLVTINGKGETLQRYNMMTGDPGYLQKDLTRYGAATPESVQQWAKSTLTQPRVELHIWPTSQKPTEAP